ncbi:transcriptional regulator [Virgibacillus sp. AGTR]|uniref:ArpU family phage packaging/lysis transcriptional regulator n=2 Tax=Virgibacillus TaxID=84406 RepID=UPI0019627AAD|nr:ArpU family phage packaging/lysis transcriptional regulator [Virgibacillus sp. AGTR]MCC2250511.1 transcriptional regulator [Virgibacillus sp. AGTR]QRZ18299.1 transcriptional regulator [Virgibacillus sp. AGTR]
MGFELPELDRKQTQKAVEAALEKYRIYKYLTFERESSTTSHIDDVGGGRSNIPGDQTGSIAVHNVSEQERIRKYCDRIERSVRRLPKMERFLIEERYLKEDAEYITDINVYCFKFQPPISAMTYSKLRWKAFYKLALNLNIAVTRAIDTD